MHCAPKSNFLHMDCVHMVEGVEWALNKSRGCWLKGYEPDCQGCHIYITDPASAGEGSPFVQTKACLIEVSKVLTKDNVSLDYATKVAKFINLGVDIIRGM